MARQRPTRLVMGPCIVEIDRIVIREVQYQFEVNRCRNEEIIVKGNFGWVWSMWAGRPRIDCIVIREVQYQFEVNRCRNEEIIVKAILGGCGLVMGPCIVEIDPNVIREVQYQFEVNPCRNEKIIVNGIFWWVWPMWAGAPGLGLGPCIVEIDPNVITKVQYQFEVNPCRNEKIIVNGNFWWVWPTVQPKRHKHNPRLRHGQIIIPRRPNRVFTQRIAVALGIDPRNDVLSRSKSAAYVRGGSSEKIHR
ncbi:hypothetical protein DPMN_121419 [Dreissena polymorpha]|uniref:Uncharacterized protein n=1 Tax=Dreissena polymorpha TaxID=45954 RepID=A0A9D4GTI4_DREPO|nr:hypothetical protein DPMN_121419 [Dreissena polymorpha]